MSKVNAVAKKAASPPKAEAAVLKEMVESPATALAPAQGAKDSPPAEPIPTDEELRAVCPNSDFEGFKAWLNRMTKIALYREAREWVGEVKKLEGVIEEKGIEIDKLYAEIECLKEINAILDNGHVKKDAEIARLRAISVGAAGGRQVTATADSAAPDALVEIVALPDRGVVVPDLEFGGRKAKRWVDADNFVHFSVDAAQAESLLGSRSGLKFVLVGPDSVTKMAITRPKGNYSEVVDVYRHVKAQYSTGGVFWQPVIPEEESDGDA